MPTDGGGGGGERGAEFRKKLGKSSISMRKVIVTLIVQGFHHKNHFFGMALVQVQ